MEGAQELVRRLRLPVTSRDMRSTIDVAKCVQRWEMERQEAANVIEQLLKQLDAVKEAPHA